MNGARRFAIVDRDGTLIRDRGYLADPAGVELLPGTAAGLRRLRASGLGIVVASNQSGIGRGLFDLPRLEAVHRRLHELLAEAATPVDGIFFCPHAPGDGCDCRKPQPGLVHRAAAELGFDPRQSFVIGDDVCDIELGRRIGAVTLLVKTGHGAAVAATGATAPDCVVDDLAAAARVVGAWIAGTPAAEAR